MAALKGSEWFLNISSQSKNEYRIISSKTILQNQADFGRHMRCIVVLGKPGVMRAKIRENQLRGAIKLKQNMKTILHVIVISYLVVMTSACTTMTIEGDGQKTAQSKTGTHTVHGSFYGFAWSAPPVTKCDNGHGLYRARYHTNAIYVLVSVVSIGLYVPQTVEWWCDGTPKPNEEEELYVPGRN